MSLSNPPFLSLQAIMQLPCAVYCEDAAGIILGCNPSCATLLGYASPHEIIGKNHADVFQMSSKARYQDSLHRVIDLQETLSVEEMFERPDGTSVCLQALKMPWRNDQQVILGLISFAAEVPQVKPQAHALNTPHLPAEQAMSLELLSSMSSDFTIAWMGILSEAAYLEKQVTSVELRESAHCLWQAVQQLLRIRDERVAAIGSGLELIEQPKSVFDPVQVIHNVIALMRTALRQRSLNLKIEIDPRVPAVVKGYGQYFERILSHLLGNAIQFTQAGFVAVYLRFLDQSSDEVTLQLGVEDTGSGMPAHQKEEIFQQFSQVSPANDDQPKGRGLGLYLVKKYVTKMQGSVDVYSVLGRGSQLNVTLTFAKAVAAVTVCIDHFRNSPRPALHQLNACEITTLDTSKNKKVKILVVEDAPLPARAVLRLLEDYDCEVKLVGSGEEAVKAVIKKRYDLILMDIGLPGIDGLEATRQIRALPVHNDMPIVAVTGHVREEKKSECLKAGMQNMYTKPLMRQQLKNLFETYLDRNENKAVAALQISIDKDVLDIQAMLGRFAMTHPKQLVEVFEVAIACIDDNLLKLEAAILAKNLEIIHSVIFDLKGGLAYLAAVQCNDLLIAWNGALTQKTGETAALYDMLAQIREALSVLKNAIEKVLCELIEVDEP
jgi:two-component system aerobic respiration control sensor histidine kinase ArcB